MRRWSRLLRRGDDHASRPAAQEELETPSSVSDHCVPARTADVDHHSVVADVYGVDRALDPSTEQAPTTTQAGQAPTGSRSTATDRMGGSAVAVPAASAPAAAGETRGSQGAAVEAEVDEVPSSCTATTAQARANDKSTLESGQRIPGSLPTGTGPSATPAPVGPVEQVQSALEAPDTAPAAPSISLAPGPSQSALPQSDSQPYPPAPPESPESQPQSTAPAHVQSAFAAPDPSRVPRTLPLGTTMIVQGLVQTIEVNRPPASVPAANTHDTSNESEEDKPDEETNGEGSASQDIIDSNEAHPRAVTPPRSTTPSLPPTPPNFTSIPNRPGVPPPSSTDVLGLLLSIAAQATAEALVPWSVPPRSRAPASWTGGSGREGIASGLAAAFSALASAGPTSTPPPPPPPPPPPAPIPVPAPVPILAPVAIAPPVVVPEPAPVRRQDSTLRRFTSRRLSSLVPRRAGSRQSTGASASSNDTTAVLNDTNDTRASAVIDELITSAPIDETTSAPDEPNPSTPTPIPATNEASTSTTERTTSTGSNAAANTEPKTDRRRGVLGALRRLVPWRSGSGRSWRSGTSSRRTSQPQSRDESIASVPLARAPGAQMVTPTPVVQAPAPTQEVEEAADFGRAPPTLVAPTALPESSVAPSPEPDIPISPDSPRPATPSSSPSPPPTDADTPSIPPTPPSTDAEDLVRFSQMLGFTPGAVHPSGTFERFLADMQEELRTALNEYQDRVRSRGRDEPVEPADPARLLDHTRPHVPSTDPLPLNWWRMYRFSALPGVEVAPNTVAGTVVTAVPPASEVLPVSVPVAALSPAVDSIESPPELVQSGGVAPVSGESAPGATVLPVAPPDDNTPQPVHPAIIIGLRSVMRDPLDDPPPGSGNEAGGDTGPRRSWAPRDPWARRFGVGRESTRREDEVEGEAEERRPREGTRNYIIWIIGGYYPSGHPLLLHPNLFLGQVHPDELWMLNEFLGQVKPPTASREEIAKAGLRIVKGTEVQELASSGTVTENCTERCLICLDDYADEEDLRILNCKHMFHKDCVDRWMETGRNNCPACRTKGVDTTTTTTA